MAWVNAAIGDTVAIFEIRYKSKTDQQVRPDPWCEVDAESFIMQQSIVPDQFMQDCCLNLSCIRSRICQVCTTAIASEECPRVVECTYKQLEYYPSEALQEASRLKTAIRMKLPHRRCKRGVYTSCSVCRMRVQNAYRSLLLTDIDESVKFYILPLVKTDSLHEASRLKNGIRMELPHKKCRSGSYMCSDCQITLHDACKFLLLTDIDDTVREHILRSVDIV